MKFDHIGVFVKSLEFGRSHFESLLPVGRISDPYDEKILKVSAQFIYDLNGICYEIIAPNGEGNPVDAVLKSGKNLLNHVAYKVDDLGKSIEDFRKKGCIPLGLPKASSAFGGANVVFFLTPLGIILELIESAN